MDTNEDKNSRVDSTLISLQLLDFNNHRLCPIYLGPINILVKGCRRCNAVGKVLNSAQA